MRINNLSNRAALLAVAGSAQNISTQFPQQLVPAARQGFFQSKHGFQRRAGRAFFQALKIGAVNPGQFAQLFLRQARRHAELVQVLADDLVAIHRLIMVTRLKKLRRIYAAFSACQEICGRI
jgi:hypothetical protein